MDRITISRDERDQLRSWLMDLEGSLGDLGMSIFAGRSDEVEELRERITWGLGVLDEIGWEVDGDADCYLLAVTPEIVAYVETQREIAEENSHWGESGVRRELEETAIEEQAKGRAEKAIAESMLERFGLAPAAVTGAAA